MSLSIRVRQHIDVSVRDAIRQATSNDTKLSMEYRNDFINALYRYAIQTYRIDQLQQFKEKYPIVEIYSFYMHYNEGDMIADKNILNGVLSHQLAVAKEQGWQAVLSKRDYNHFFGKAHSFMLKLTEETFTLLEELAPKEASKRRVFIENLILSWQGGLPAINIQEKLTVERRIRFRFDLKAYLNKLDAPNKSYAMVINAILNTQLKRYKEGIITYDQP